MVSAMAILAAITASQQPPSDRPNFVVIFCDDLGYGDLSCYGQTAYRTPNLDRMVSEGMRFTDFYAASPACSPSRAALLTGCYPMRVSVPQVLNPESPTGLSLDEQTIAEVLKPKGYATACVGKWHLGVKNLLPTHQGFDTYFGLPYSNDMWPQNGKNWPPLLLFRDTQPVEEIRNLDDQATLTGRYTQFATDFIKTNRHRPFFLYLAHSMTHVPIAASREFLGKSGRGLYADTVLEVDASVGRILRTLKDLKLDKKTLVVFTSDNGPWRPYGNHAGSPGPFREGKGTTFEAGMREPGIFWWPGQIPAGKVCREMATTMDLLPTLASISGALLPEKPIDGHDIGRLLRSEPGAKSPYKWFFYWWPDELQAIRSGDWKLHVPHKHRHQTQPAGTDGKPAGEVTKEIGLSLFDLRTDPGESNNVADQHPDTVRRLLAILEIGRRELGDKLTKTKGTDVRTPGRVMP